MWFTVCLERPYWFLNHSKHLHCLCQANPVISLIQDWEIQPQEDVTQDPGVSRCPHCVLFKGGKAVASRMLGEADIHQKALTLTCNSHKYPDPTQFLLLFPTFGKYQGIFSLAGDMRVHPQPKRAKTWGCHEEECGGGKDWELGIQRNDKQQNPTVAHKEID